MRHASIASLLGALLVALCAATAARAQTADSTRAYATLSVSTELTDATVFTESGILFGRLHRLGGDGAWSLRGELAAGIVRLLDGRSAYGGLSAAASRAWKQDLFHFSDHFSVRPALTVGAGLYRFGYADDIAGLAPWVPVGTVGAGLHGVAPAERGALFGRIFVVDLVREHRFGDGWEPRWFMRLGVGLGTAPRDLIPPRRPPDWWDTPAPEIAAGPARGRALRRPELPHHVFGYRAREWVPGVLQDPEQAVLDPSDRARAPIAPPQSELGTRSRVNVTKGALERHPEDAFAMHEHGVALAARGRLAAGLRAFRHALAGAGAARQRAIILTDIGTAWAALGWADSAAAVWRAAHAEDPELLAPLLNLGVLLEELGQAEAALTHYREAAAAEEGQAAPWENLAYALVRLGRGDEALAPLRRALLLREGARGVAALRWRCHDLALHRELTGEESVEGGRCARTSALPSPRLLPEG
ncbi:MAG TPA: hypothetical protein VMK65_08950 [Longimicrobiales bacterium]|nr:hypothetical protein [Longimicrobiales bacterium]